MVPANLPISQPRHFCSRLYIRIPSTNEPASQRVSESVEANPEASESAIYLELFPGP